MEEKKDASSGKLVEEKVEINLIINKAPKKPNLDNYDSRKFRFKQRTQKMQVLDKMINFVTTPLSKENKQIVVMGDASFSSVSPGHGSAPIKTIQRMLKKKKGELYIEINEFRSSIACHKCWNRNVKWEYSIELKDEQKEAISKLRKEKKLAKKQQELLDEFITEHESADDHINRILTNRAKKLQEKISKMSDKKRNRYSKKLQRRKEKYKEKKEKKEALKEKSKSNLNFNNVESSRQTKKQKIDSSSSSSSSSSLSSSSLKNNSMQDSKNSIPSYVEKLHTNIKLNNDLNMDLNNLFNPDYFLKEITSHSRVLYCPVCKLYFNRDVNAVKNLFGLFWCDVVHTGRPEIFTRQMKKEVWEKQEIPLDNSKKSLWEEIVNKKVNNQITNSNSVHKIIPNITLKSAS